MSVAMSYHNSAHEAQYTTRKIPHVKLLTDFEEFQIVAYKRELLSIRNISQMFSRSPKCIWTFKRV